MGFTLKKVINGSSRTFSNRKILELLGDPGNDEINLDGEAFRLSSFVGLDTGSGGAATIWEEKYLEVGFPGQQIFRMDEAIGQAESIQLTVNGILYNHGQDKSFHVTAQSVYWHGAFALETSDVVKLKYLKSI